MKYSLLLMGVCTLVPIAQGATVTYEKYSGDSWIIPTLSAPLNKKADTDYLWTTNFNVHLEKIDKLSVTPRNDTRAGVGVSTTISQVNHKKGSKTEKVDELHYTKANANGDRYLMPHVPIGHGRSDSWSLDINHTVQTSNPLLITSISLDMVCHPMDASPRDGYGSTVTLDLGNYGSISINNLWSHSDAGKVKTLTFDLASLTNSIILDNHNSDFSYSIKVGNDESKLFGGTACYGISNIKVNGEAIPEPSTISLALLGFGAFLMRRRRQS